MLHLVGTFTLEQLEKNEDKVAIEKEQKATNLKYIISKVVKENKIKKMRIWLTNDVNLLEFHL